MENMRGALHLFPLVCLGAAACGSIAADPDATPPDSTPIQADANPRGPVQVTVLTMDRDERPYEGATVVFVEADGTVVARKTSDAAGHASADMLPGASVTVAWLRADGARLVTLLDVDPGDEILVGGRKGRDFGTMTATTQVTIAPQPGAMYHYVYTSCGTLYYADANQPQNIQWYAGCQGDNRDYLAVAIDPNSNAVRSSVVMNQQPSATVSIPGSWQYAPTFRGSYTNIPSTVGSLNLERRLRSNGWDAYYSSGYAQVTGAAAAIEIPYTPNALDDMRLTTQIYPVPPGQGGIYYQNQMIRAVRQPGSSYGVDLGSLLLPWVGQPTLDVNTRMITWPQQGTGGTPDAGVIDMYYYRMVPPPGGGNPVYQYYSWRVIAPGLTSPLTLPQLPAEVGDIGPKTGDMGGGGALSLIQVEDQDYPDLRKRLDLDYEDLASPYQQQITDAQVVVSGVSQSDLRARR